MAVLAARADVTLQNQQWTVRLEPATLGIRVQPAGKQSIEASIGVPPQAVTGLTQQGSHCHWLWRSAGQEIDATLEDGDLRLTIRAETPALVTILRQPAQPSARALVLPLAEGHYIPATNPAWRDYLVGQKEFNTTEDLSLPLWGMDYGSFSLHWLLTNPFNNALAIHPESDGFAVTMSHRFTSLAQGAPMTLLLHLAGPDLLAGAKRYRAWLVQQGLFESLQEKFAQVPEGRKLAGAPQIYLWGGGLIAPDDVLDWPAFLSDLRESDPFPSGLRQRLSTESKALLVQRKGPLRRDQQQLLIRAINDALNAWARESWQTAHPDLANLPARYAELSAGFQRQFGSAMSPDPNRWGSGLSLETIRLLREAGLSRLWIGTGEGWEAGLWRPAAVRAAVQAGYLIAPYDAYETALPPGLRPDWSTAQLGQDSFTNCAITLEDGSIKSGFNKLGHYTNPLCIRPLLQERIRLLQAATGFNSWFLDSYAAGMLFNDYGSKFQMSEDKMAQEYSASMRWISESLKLPLGSEDGNAVTARGLLFAQGMQTPVIGWGRAEMQRNPRSPYFLGRWYPPEEPEVFFKPVPLEEELRTIHFDPRYRLPLYQAVFHDSVISTQHWTADNLKFLNARIENELAQLLYNVPPLYHLSAATLATRIPLIRRQDAFFRPLHQRLAADALTGFSWLSPDHLLQQTSFSDHTRLIANFSGSARTLDGIAYPAHSVTALQPAQAARTYIP